MTLRSLLFSIACLLLVSIYALPRSMNGNGNGNDTLIAAINRVLCCEIGRKATKFCTFQLLFQPFQWNVRRYYLAAEEVEWDYAKTE